MNRFRGRLRDDERGIAAVVVVIVVIALMGAAMLTLDAGNIWTTRRGIITGTDASVLDAAQMFNTGVFNACEATSSGSPSWTAANQHATDVLTQNHTRSEHDLTDPVQFAVEVLDPSQCATGGYTPGKVTYEGRLEAQGFFSQVFGFGNTKPYSTSTAIWGYIQSIGEGLRPFSVCQGDRQFTDYLTYWQALHDGDPSNDASATATYDALYGSDNGFIEGGFPADQDPSDGVTPNEMTVDGVTPAYGLYPMKSMGYPPGEADGGGPGQNPNFGKTYTSPSFSTTGAVFHPVARVVTPDPTSSCGHANGNKGWVDLRGAGDSGTIGASELRAWLLNGYPGEVSLSPEPDCDPTEDGSPEACGSAPGDRARLMEALEELTCDVATPALSCEYVFPILVVDCIGRKDPSTGACIQDSGTGGENAEYSHTAFIFIVLRGFGKIASSGDLSCTKSDCTGDRKKGVLALDMEFVDVQTTGEVAGAPPVNSPIYQTGTQLCGADHAENCPF